MFLFVSSRRSTYLRAFSGPSSNTKTTKAAWILSREVLSVSFPCSMRLAAAILQNESWDFIRVCNMFFSIDVTISTACIFLLGKSSQSGLWTEGIEGSSGEGSLPEPQHKLGQVQPGAALHCSPLCWQGQLPDRGDGGEEQGVWREWHKQGWAQTHG